MKTQDDKKSYQVQWEETKEELKNLNAELEERVKERTSQLSQAIMELQQIDDDLEKEIEQRKKVEEELRQAFERQKELNELKSRFVSMASHEFRTPLSGILTSVSLISRYRDPADEDKRNKHINIIKQAVHNLTNILNEFLSLDKMEQGGIACHPSLFSLVEFVSELVEEKHVLYEQEQRIIYEHKGKNDLVNLDKDILRNILINLISNAMKYSSVDKKIYLKTELRNTNLHIVIKDNGIGIPKADQKHLFERFFRAQNALTIQGTGLGLNIIKKYLNLMGGSIHFTSQENIGTTFTVKIPYEKNSTN